MLQPTRVVYTLALAAVMAGSARPVAAGTVEACYAKVLGWCSDAMDGANWLERFAIGELCSAMLVGCTGANIIKT